MNFTPKRNIRFVAGGILAIAAVGLIGWGSHVTPAPIRATPDAFAAQEPYQTIDHIPIVPLVEYLPAGRAGYSTSSHYQTVSSWYKNKHWWKRNAPVVGGAAGGALIGGLAGGGTGALIGGAAGGGAGYLYKRERHHSHHHYDNYYGH